MLTKILVLSEPHEAHPKSLDFMRTPDLNNTDAYPKFLSEADIRSSQDPRALEFCSTIRLSR